MNLNLAIIRSKFEEAQKEMQMASLTVPNPQVTINKEKQKKLFNLK